MSGRRRSSLALVLGVAVAAALWAGRTAPAGAGSPSTTAAPTTAAPTTAAPTTAAPTTAAPTTARPTPTTPRTTARPATTTTPPTTAPTTVSTDTTLPTTVSTDTTTTSTTAPTTTSPPVTVAPEERVQADTPGDRAQQRLRLVIWGLLALAGLSLVSTMVFWRLTRPRPDEDVPAMRWAAPGDPTVAEAAPVLVGAAAAGAVAGEGLDPVTEPHPVVTVPAAPAEPFAAPPPVVNDLPPGPQVPAEPVADLAVTAAVAAAAADVPEAIVPSEVLDPSTEFEAEDGSVPPAAADPGPPSVSAAGMWASTGWGDAGTPAAVPDPAPAPAPEPVVESAVEPVVEPEAEPTAEPASAPFDFDAPQ